MNLLKLFGAFLAIGGVAFGGGYAVLPLLQRMIVDDRAWLTMTTFVDMIAISQITPGPIAINSATFIGYQTTGSILGAAIATTGVITMPALLVGIVAYHSDKFRHSATAGRVLKGLRPALIGLIFASVFLVARTAIIDWFGPILIALYVALLAKWKVHPVLVVLLSGIIGIVIYYII